MALVGRTALLEYDVGGPRVIHERMILEHVNQENYVVCTPDRDIYVEELSVSNPDLRAFRLRPAPNQLPPGVAQNQLYGLPAWGAAELAAIRAEAADLGRQERANLGPGGPVVAPAAAAAGVVQSQAPEGQGPGAVRPDGADLKWVAAEGTSTVRFGQVIAGINIPMVRGGKAVHVHEGHPIFCMCIDSGSVVDFNNRPSACDGRILGRRMNAIGTPERTLSEVVAECHEYDMGWNLDGPRTAKWCLNYLVVEGLGFEGHHERFRQLCKLEPSSWGVQEHFQMSMVLRQMMQVDMINGFNTLSAELMFRRLQTIEYGHAERAREAESRGAGGKLTLEEQYTFGSMIRQAGTLMVAPQLLTHVKEAVEKDVTLQKNLRKAREERELARKSNKGKPGESNP